jgi:hypothetical protein
MQASGNQNQDDTMPGKTGKVSLDEANYRNSGDDGKSCSNCENFNAPDQCNLVNGTISAAGMCDLWAKKRDETDLMNQLFGDSSVNNGEANTADVPPGQPA